MLIYNCAQGSPEWHQCRAGVITASMFDVARERVGGLTEQQGKYVSALLAGATESDAMKAAEYKSKPRAASIDKALKGEKVGDFSESAKNYAFRLAIERISKQPLDEGFETFAMRRGHELEPAARMEHESQSGQVVIEAGFATTDDGLFGASADGFIGSDGGAEYKCFINPEKLRSFHIDNDASGIFGQVQGCMWVCDRKWWHVGMYCPALESVDRQLWWQEFKRDDDFIAQMESDLMEFKKLVDEYESRLRTKAA